MHKRLNVSLLFVSCLIMMLVVAVPVYATTSQPPEWPWRGVNMDSISSTPADIRALVGELGVNSVHLQVRPEKLSKLKHLSANVAWSQSIAWVDAMLEACKKYHIVGIVEVTGIPLKKPEAKMETTAAFWMSSSKKREYLHRVESLAKRLQRHGSEFAAYDIMSEPVMIIGGHAFQPQGWYEFQKKIVHALRTNDRSRWIMVKPGPFGSPKGYKDFTPLALPRLIYSVHMYDPHRFTHQGVKHYPLGPKFPGRIGSKIWDVQALERDLAPVINFQKKYQVPIYVGEFSAVRWAPGAEVYIKDLVSIFNVNDWGWAYFSFNGWNGWNPNYNSEYPINKSVIKSDYVGKRSRRWSTLRKILPIGDH